MYTERCECCGLPGTKDDPLIQAEGGTWWHGDCRDEAVQLVNEPAEYDGQRWTVFTTTPAQAAKFFLVVVCGYRLTEI